MINTLNQTPKQQAQKRWCYMRDEYNRSWQASHRDLKTFVNQLRGAFEDQANRGQMINHQQLLSGYATRACKTLASGLLSGMTSPTRPWVKWEIDDMPQEDLSPDGKKWMDNLHLETNRILNRANCYSSFYSSYEELGQFGGSSFIMLTDFETTIRCRNFTAGEYYIAVNEKGRVNAFSRYFWMTVLQIVEEFGLESCSGQVKSLYASGNYDTWIRINHLIEENKDRQVDMFNNQNMKYRSLYWEQGNGNEFLRRSGFGYFPIIATRWETTTTDQIYGYGPGWYALGAIKELQKTRLDKLLMQEKLHNPPYQEDASVEGHANLLPGGKTKITGSVPNSGVRASYQVPDALASFLELIREEKEEIDAFFFVDIMRMTTTIDPNIQRTAQEWAIRNQEKIMLMGPVLYKVKDEMLDPFMENLFFNMMDQNVLPPPPKEIAGMPLKIKYVSILAQAQEALGIEQVNRVVGFVGTYATIAPQMLDVVNWDDLPGMINNMEGGPEKVILSKDQIQANREQKAQQQQMMLAQQATEMAETGTKAVKNLADSKTGDGSVLDNISQAMQNIRGGR